MHFTLLAVSPVRQLVVYLFPSLFILMSIASESGIRNPTANVYYERVMFYCVPFMCTVPQFWHPYFKWFSHCHFPCKLYQTINNFTCVLVTLSANYVAVIEIASHEPIFAANPFSLQLLIYRRKIVCSSLPMGDMCHIMFCILMWQS